MPNKIVYIVKNLFAKKKQYFTEMRMAKAVLAGKAVVGKHSYGKIDLIGDISKIYIGESCSSGPGCCAFIGNNHRYGFVSTYPFSYTKRHGQDWGACGEHRYCNGDMIIGNDVWLGRDATILSGVTIGDGAVVGVKSLVTKMSLHIPWFEEIQLAIYNTGLNWKTLQNFLRCMVALGR